MIKLPMTAAGYSALENELKHRVRAERARLIQRIQEAIADDSNLAENSEYQAAKAEQEINEARIAELEDKLSRAEVIDVSKLSGAIIKFGATVTLIDKDTETRWYGSLLASQKRMRTREPLAGLRRHYQRRGLSEQVSEKLRFADRRLLDLKYQNTLAWALVAQETQSGWLYRLALHFKNLKRTARRFVIEHCDHQPPSIPSEGVKVRSVLF